mmetsp:Transcript_33512/g.33754  ORF Transcript_33512/g.33754 Transcript_33512/m.33754 type:complete len:140 (-) Transcript_33512:623-1042(-)|eukprot:CAMPEP_0171299612 /NCGR_PEP_ID=MMETSP0816-20121228/8451_1 /TAXON_ID=420281 /ORGANISM="Proboscia inermis, Strain CCAP1064/1" /LENGTH=139 /DNA_ID=CAMNT_0011775549 /DNA_START=463 /DNA_END=882 /DNA_ORIENTATION=-
MVVPTYALEHKLFAKDALLRWETAQLWTSPAKFSFSIEASDAADWGCVPVSVLYSSDVDGQQPATTPLTFTNETFVNSKPPWTNEIQYETLFKGSFPVLGFKTSLQFYETAFSCVLQNAPHDRCRVLNICHPANIHRLD